MRYVTKKSKNFIMIGKNNEIKSHYYIVYDTLEKKNVSGDFFYKTFAEDLASDLNISEKFGKK